MDHEGGAPARIRSINVHPSRQWSADTAAERRSNVREWVSLADEANLNVLFAWLESPHAAALLGEERYQEQYPFWDTRSWDPFGEILAAAGEHDIEVHPWYSFTRYKRDRDWTPEYDPDLSALPPGDPDWASVRKSEYDSGHRDPSDPAVDGEALCGNAVGAHQWTLDVLSRVFDSYPGLDGLRIEEPGYLELDRCVCYRCRAVHEQLSGDDGDRLLGHVYDEVDEYREDETAVRVKMHGTDDFVRRLALWWNRAGDGRQLTFNGSWDPSWDRARGRNWAEWSTWGVVPYFSPQAYSTDVDETTEQIRTTMEGVAGETTIVPSLGISWSGGTNDPETVVAQVEAALAQDGYEDVSIGGINLFSGRSLTSELANRLSSGPYLREPSLPWRE